MATTTLSTRSLPSRPPLNSRFASNPHKQIAAITSKVRSYFIENWPWTSEEEKAAYPTKDLEEWTLSVIPSSPDERAEVITRWGTLLFLYDDLMETFAPDQAREELARFQNILSKLSGPAETMPIEMTADEAIFADLISKLIFIEDKSLQELGHSFVKELIGWTSVVSSLEERRRAFESGFDTYMIYRFQDVGAWLTLYLILWARKIPFPSRVDMGPKFKTLADVALLQCTYVNDFYSYGAEVAALNREEARRLEKPHQKDAGESSDLKNGGPLGYTVFNGVHVFVKVHGLTPEDAYAKMIEKIHSVETQYTALLEELRSEYRTSGDMVRLDILEEFSNALIDLMGGNADWSGVCGRYNIY